MQCGKKVKKDINHNMTINKKINTTTNVTTSTRTATRTKPMTTRMCKAAVSIAANEGTSCHQTEVFMTSDPKEWQSKIAMLA